MNTIKIPRDLIAIHISDHTAGELREAGLITNPDWPPDYARWYLFEFEFKLFDSSILIYGGYIIGERPDNNTLSNLLDWALHDLNHIGDHIWHELWNNDPDSGEINFK